jgi:hypothetical protein
MLTITTLVKTSLSPLVMVSRLHASEVKALPITLP